MSSFFFKIFVIVIVGTSAFNANLFARAQTADKLKEQISVTEDKIQKLEQEIKQLDKDIVGTATQKKTLNALIKSLDLTRKKLETELRITQTKVDTANLKIKQLSSEILYKENEIESRTNALIETLRVVRELDTRSLAEVVFSGESFSGLWNDFEMLNQFSGEVKGNLDILQTLKEGFKERQGRQQIQKHTLLSLKEELSDRKKIAEQSKKEKAGLLVQTKNQEAVFQKLLRGKQVLKDAFEKELNDYESRLQFLLDPKSIPPRGTKVFSPPLDSIYITQNFGKTSASGRLYASGTHNGTDFRASVGTAVKAMADGVVAGTGDTDITCRGASFGKWVLIRYKNGLAATFAHLSLIKVSAGDTVSAGSIIGYSGNTGYSTGPHLHVSVYANAGVNIQTLPSKSCGGRTYTLPLAAPNAYLDPIDYL